MSVHNNWRSPLKIWKVSGSLLLPDKTNKSNFFVFFFSIQLNQHKNETKKSFDCDDDLIRDGKRPPFSLEKKTEGKGCCAVFMASPHNNAPCRSTTTTTTATNQIITRRCPSIRPGRSSLHLFFWVSLSTVRLIAKVSRSLTDQKVYFIRLIALPARSSFTSSSSSSLRGLPSCLVQSHTLRAVGRYLSLSPRP